MLSLRFVPPPPSIKLQLVFYGFPETFDVQALFTEITLLGGLVVAVSTLPTYLFTFASVAGLSHRVGQLLDTQDVVLKTYNRFDKEKRVRHAGHVELENVSCNTPDGLPLFKNMTFSVKRSASKPVAAAAVAVT